MVEEFEMFKISESFKIFSYINVQIPIQRVVTSPFSSQSLPHRNPATDQFQIFNA